MIAVLKDRGQLVHKLQMTTLFLLKYYPLTCLQTQNKTELPLIMISREREQNGECDFCYKVLTLYTVPHSVHQHVSFNIPNFYQKEP